MANYSSQNKFHAEKMTIISARFSNTFANTFKQSCAELNVSQADVIRTAMEEIIMEANTKLINDVLLNPTKENVSHFLDTRDGGVFMLRDFETTKLEIAKSRYEYKHCEFSVSEKDLLNDIVNNPMQDNLHCNESDMWDSLDEVGENGYSILENDLWYNITEWNDGTNTKNIYIFK